MLAALELKIPPVALWLVFAGLAALATWLTPDLRWPPGLATLVGAIILAELGVAAGVLGVWAFHKAATTHHPMHPERTARIVTGGIYRLSRNPMYLGLALVLAALAVYLRSPLALVAVPAFMAALTRLQILPEERVLAARFGEDYRAYLASARRWL